MHRVFLLGYRTLKLHKYSLFTFTESASIAMEKANSKTLTGVERFFGEDDIIVSKTNIKGHLTYANRVFIDISGFTEEEILGAPHSILRHPKMPRCIFQLLWQEIQAKREIFAYVVNRCKNGDHYWVLAHVTPSLNEHGEIDGFHSNRRVPDPSIVSSTIIPLYNALLEEENKHSNAKQGMQKSFEMLQDILKQKEVSYERFIFSLQG